MKNQQWLYKWFFLHLALTYQMILLVSNKIQAKQKVGKINVYLPSLQPLSFFPPFPQQP